MLKVVVFVGSCFSCCCCWKLLELVVVVVVVGSCWSRHV